MNGNDGNDANSTPNYPPTTGVSVVVCCYNSEKRLPQTLAHLACQQLGEGIPWEVIVVDNASTDKTSMVALSLWEKHVASTPLRVVYQPVQGLSAARAMGLAKAAYEIVVFCDDDNWLADSYVDRAFHAMQAHPDAAVLGGVGEPACETEPPPWFFRYARYYALGEQATGTGDVSDTKGYVYGAGLVLRQSAWKELELRGFKSQLTGRKGDSLASSEDRELCYALRLLGHRIYFDDTLRFKHEIPAKRLRWEYFLKMVETAQHTTPIMSLYNAALAGQAPLQKGTARWQSAIRCLDLALQVFRKPRQLIALVRRVEGSASAVRWHQTRGACYGWVRVGLRYAELQDAVYTLSRRRPPRSISSDS